MTKDKIFFEDVQFQNTIGCLFFDQVESLHDTHWVGSLKNVEERTILMQNLDDLLNSIIYIFIFFVATWMMSHSDTKDPFQGICFTQWLVTFVNFLCQLFIFSKKNYLKHFRYLISEKYYNVIIFILCRNKSNSFGKTIQTHFTPPNVNLRDSVLNI